MESTYFQFLYFSIQTSAIDLALKKLACLYLCTGFSACHQCQ